MRSTLGNPPKKKRRPILWFLVLVVAGVLVYRYQHRTPASYTAYKALENITPDSLTFVCGEPATQSNGLVVKDDVIRDLRYNDKSGNPIFFRFISGDDSTWHSLGAWQDVSAPADLGSPLPAAEAVRRLPCALSAQYYLSRLAPAGLPSSLALLLPFQEVPGGAASHPFTPPGGGTYGTTQAPGGTTLTNSPGLSGISNIHAPTGFGNTGGSPPSGSGKSNDEDEKGGGGGEGSESGLSHIRAVLPCPPDLDACKMLDYAEFSATMYQAITAEQENHYEKAMNLVGRNPVLVVQLPALTIDRAEAVKSVFQLEARVINLVAAQLHSDVAQILPFPQESAALKAQKMAVVEQDDRAMRQMWKQAIDENRPRISAAEERAEARAEAHQEAQQQRQAEREQRQSESDGQRSMRFESHAYDQLVNIHLSGIWP